MNATEAREMTFNSIPEISKRAIEQLYTNITFSAGKGFFSADLELGKIPTISSVVNGIVENFQEEGYRVNLTDQEMTVKVTVSWSEQE